MKLNIIKYFTIALTLTVFAISLTQNSVTIDYQEIRTVPSYEYFLMGSTAFLGGGIFEQIIWSANPLSLVAIFLLVFNNNNAKVFSTIALVLSASFSTWKELLGAESGAMAKIIALESGYYLWVLSICILTSGTFIYFKIGRSELGKQNKFKFKKPRIF